MADRPGSFIEPGELWQDVWSTSRRATFYQHPTFAIEEARLLGGRPLAFVTHDNSRTMLLPLIEREIPGSEFGLTDLIAPYGYPGILSDGEVDTDTFLETFNAAAAERGAVTTFLRLAPWQANPPPGERWSITDRGETVIVNTSQGLDATRCAYSTAHRRNLRRLHADGFEVVRNDWARYRDWQRVYNDAMTRLDSKPYYRFDERYFDTLRTELEAEFVLVVSRAGELAAGGLFFIDEQFVHYHLGATAQAHVRRAPSKLMFDAVIEFAAGRQRSVHLGGGVGGADDSLFRFKSGFGPGRMTFSTVEMIHDRPTYAALAPSNLDTSFFPAYR